jgi:hypothetical protein
MAEMLESRQPILHKGRVILCGVLIGLIVLFEALFLDSLAKGALKDGLEMAVGAEVNIEDVDISLFGGRFSMGGVQLTDAAKPTHNSLQYAKLTSDISTASLLAKRFVIDELVIAGGKTEAKRAKPGYVLRKPEPPEPEITEDTISKYFEDGEKILDYLGKLKKYMEKREKGQERKQAEAPEADKEELKRLAKAHGYLRLSAKSVLAKHPAVVIRKLRIEGIEVAGKKYEIVGSELSESPELNPEPMSLRVNDEDGFLASLTLNFHDPGKSHSVRIVAPNISLSEAGLTKKVPLDISKGKVDAKLDGHFDNRAVNFPVALHVSDLQAGSTRSFLGLDPQTSKRITKHLTRIDLTVGLRGPIEAPRVFLDDKKLLASLQKAMKDAAQAELVGALDGQLKKIVPSVPIKLPGGVTDPLKGLLPGRDKPKKKGPESKPSGLLERL